MSVQFQNGSLLDTKAADPRIVAAATDWAAVPTLQNSWANATGFNTLQFRRDLQGTIHLRGSIDSGTKTAATLITTLASGYRPAAKVKFPVAINASTTDYIGTVVIDTDGTVTVGAQTWQASSTVSFDGINFDTSL